MTPVLLGIRALFGPCAQVLRPLLPLCLALVAFGPPVAAAEDVPAVVGRVIERYGGEPALRRAAILRQTGRTVALVRGQEAAMERILRPPDRLRVTLRYGDGTVEDRVLDGDAAWKNGAKTSPPLRDAMALQAARLALPRILLDRRAQLIDRGSREIDGEIVRLIELPLSEHTTLLVAVAAESARIVMSRGTMAMGGAKMEFTTRYSDFREWDGILIAAREEQFAMGRHTGFTVIERVEFPADLPKEAFLP